MKSFLNFILEKFEINKNTKASSATKEDPHNWKIGDIVCCTTGYSMCLPKFYKITRTTPTGIVVKRMAGKIIKGSRNGQWEEIADENSPLGEEFKGRIIQKGTYINVKIDGHSVYYWDGKPLFGDDMD